MSRPEAIRIERDVAVPMTDGVTLRAEVWRPDDDRPHPVVLVRTPYIKEAASPLPVTDSRLATARGYAVVVQDVRGCGSSDGSFEPFVNEERDGADTIAWVAAQPWCDGRVVMAGMSYVGATQWLAAAAQPPALKAIAPTFTSDQFGEGWSFRSGVREHGFLATWSAADLAPVAQRWLDDAQRAYDDAAGVAEVAPWTAEWLAQPPDSDYWRTRSVAERRPEIEVPALFVGGWYDIFLRATLDAFARSQHSADRLLIGPWGHDGLLSNLVGELNVGAAGAGVGQMFPRALDFYDAVLDGREPDAAKVRAYVLGGRRWVDLPQWPPPDAQTRSIPLDPGSFAVDPDDPVPSLGGRGLLVQVPGWGWGVRDQRPLAPRPDVHVALRHVFPEATTLAGPLHARLQIEASDDSYWTAIVCVEQADGRWHNLTEGIARSNAGDDAVTVECGDVCVDIAAQQALVVLLAGSSFPRWPRPTSTGPQSVLEGSGLDLTVWEPAGPVSPA